MTGMPREEKYTLMTTATTSTATATSSNTRASDLVDGTGGEARWVRLTRPVELEGDLRVEADTQVIVHHVLHAPILLLDLHLPPIELQSIEMRQR
jgi:hypothetical protein